MENLFDTVHWDLEQRSCLTLTLTPTLCSLIKSESKSKKSSAESVRGVILIARFTESPSRETRVDNTPLLNQPVVRLRIRDA